MAWVCAEVGEEKTSISSSRTASSGVAGAGSPRAWIDAAARAALAAAIRMNELLVSLFGCTGAQASGGALREDVEIVTCPKRNARARLSMRPLANPDDGASLDQGSQSKRRLR